MDIKPCMAASEMAEEDAKKLSGAIRKYVHRHYRGLPECGLEELALAISQLMGLCIELWACASN